MADRAPVHPATQRIMVTLHCSRDEAESIRRKLGAPFEDRRVREFLAIAWKLGRTTRTPGQDEIDLGVEEGKRQAGLFMASCANRLLEPDTYQQPMEGNDDEE